MTAASAPGSAPYSPGLAGVIAGESAICEVSPNAGLTYRGYDVHEMAGKAAFEEVAYLMLNGELPKAQQLETFRKQLAAEREIPKQVVEMLRLLPKHTHPMDTLRTGFSMLASWDPDLNDHSHAANLRKATRIIAEISTLTTTGWRIAHGKEPVAPKPDLSHCANFLYCFDGKEPEPWRVRAMDILFLLYAEHEFNASTFASRVTAATLADIYAAITTAIGTLKGPLHGGANEEAMKMLEDIAKPERAEAWVKERLTKKEKIMGFGHRVYKTGDSRVPVLRELTRDIGQRLGQTQWVAIGEALDRVMEREKNLYANADLYAAPVFYMMGIPADLNTPLFACSRASGWSAHVIEQHDNNRLIRPRCKYTGPDDRKYVPIEQRK
jgi:citrate synthase